MAVEKSTMQDMTVGSPVHHILKFFFPLLFGMLLIILILYPLKFYLLMILKHSIKKKKSNLLLKSRI